MLSGAQRSRNISHSTTMRPFDYAQGDKIIVTLHYDILSLVTISVNLFYQCHLCAIRNKE